MVNLEDNRLSLLGNSFFVPGVSFLLAHWLVITHYLPCLPPWERYWGQLSTAELNAVAAELKQLHGPKWSPELEAVKFLIRGSIHKGSDVRVCDGTLTNPAGWPRKSLPTRWWQWKVSYAFKLKPSSINRLEMESVLYALRRWSRSAEVWPGRILHVTDSQVALAVLVKGRTSARLLQPVLRRISALLLATSLCVAYVFVVSADNPADKPSRQWEDQKE